MKSASRKSHRLQIHGLKAEVQRKLFMHKRSLILLSLFFALLPTLPAQSGAAPHIGQVDVSFQNAAIMPGVWHLTGRVTLTSDQYDLAAEDVKVLFSPGIKGAASSLRQATATGSPAHQVIAHIRRPLESETFEIYADRAVYLPEPSRPGGGNLTFTGNVKVIVKSGFFAAPSVSTVEYATVLLGPKPDYPKLNTGAGHITLTPAQ